MGTCVSVTSGVVAFQESASSAQDCHSQIPELMTSVLPHAAQNDDQLSLHSILNTTDEGRLNLPEFAASGVPQAGDADQQAPCPDNSNQKLQSHSEAQPPPAALFRDQVVTSNSFVNHVSRNLDRCVAGVDRRCSEPRRHLHTMESNSRATLHNGSVELMFLPVHSVQLSSQLSDEHRRRADAIYDPTSPIGMASRVPSVGDDDDCGGDVLTSTPSPRRFRGALSCDLSPRRCCDGHESPTTFSPTRAREARRFASMRVKERAGSPRPSSFRSVVSHRPPVATSPLAAEVVGIPQPGGHTLYEMVALSECRIVPVLGAGATCRCDDLELIPWSPSSNALDIDTPTAPSL